MSKDPQGKVLDEPSKVAISAYGAARSTVEGAPLSSEELRKIDAYWRASLYLCLGMLYLKDNPLLREPLKVEHIKPRMLGLGPRPGLHLHPLQPADQQVRPGRDLPLRAWPWRAVGALPGLPGGDVLRDLSG